QLEDFDLPFGQAGEAQSARVEDLPLQASDLVKQPAQQVGRQRTVAGGGGADGVDQLRGGRLAPPEEAGRPGFHGGEQAAVFNPRSHDHHLVETAILERTDLPGGLIVDLVDNDQRNDVRMKLPLVYGGHRLTAELADDPVSRNRIAG